MQAVSIVFVLTICACAFQVQSDFLSESKETAQKVGVQCANEQKISIDDIMNSIKSKVLPEKLNCWASCWGVKMNLLIKDSGLNMTTFEYFEKQLSGESKKKFLGVKDKCVTGAKKLEGPMDKCPCGKNLFECLKDTPLFETK